MRNSLLLVLVFAVGQVGAADWPHQRGPLNNGHVAADAVVPKSLPDDPKVVWQIPVTDGFAAPIITGGMVVYGDFQKGKETFHAVNLSDGKPVWHDTLDSPHRDNFGTGPRCAPVSDGTVVLIQSCKGELHCLAAKTGKLLWKKNYLSDFGAPYVGEKGSTKGAARHGYAASSWIDGEQVIALAGGPGAAVVCLNRRNGEVIWKSEDDQAAYSPPRVAKLAGVEQVVCFTVDGAMGLDRSNGKLLWRVPLSTDYGRHIVAPVIYEDLAVVGSHQVGYVATRVVRKGGKVTAEEAWRLGKNMGPNFASPIRVGDHIYMLVGKEITCLDAATGKKAWAAKGVVNTSAQRAFCAFIGTGENILVLTDMGELVMFEANPKEYREISRTQVCGKNWCHPAYAGGKLVVRDAKKLICVDLLEK